MRIVILLLLAACHADAAPRERVVGGPCEGCENVFVDRPAKLASSARIAPVGEPGEPLAIDGIVRDAANRPVAGVIVYAYQTDARGLYPEAKTRHGRLRGFARTDTAGAYHFATIRPGAYPGRDIPQHVHLHVLEPGRCTYFIDDITFSDDPLVQRDTRGVATPVKDAGIWRVRRDIVLGAGISGYERC